jgi:hypothetical protein
MHPEELIKIFVTRIKTTEKIQKQTFEVNIGFLKSNEIKLQSEASSLFDVRCWMFDVRRSSFKTTLYGVYVPCECLQNKLALLGFIPARKGLNVE